MNPANTKGSGTEPLRSDPKSKFSPPPSPNLDSGKAAGGTKNMRAYNAAKTAAQLTTPKGSASHCPATVDKFSGKGV